MSGPNDAENQELDEALVQAVQAKRLTAASRDNIQPWLRESYHAEFRPKLVQLIRDRQFAELDRLFWEKIPFGTGGRRGPMAEFGSATINARTIAESAYGLAVYVKQAVGGNRWRAVIACDTRHRSQEFARVSAAVMAAQGYHVFCFAEPRATPELSFAVRHLKCDAGIMISASHNPPSDNGFKAYWSTGGQVLSPHDKGIIQCVESAGEIPQLDFNAAVHEGKIELIGAEVDEAYLTAVSALSLSPARDISALFTPLHGVGETSVYRVLERVGFTGIQRFQPQCSQDGSFPNVPDHLPNPERPDVFEPAIAAARSSDIALILASDPDADRIAAAVRTPRAAFPTLTGNQMGALLVDYVLRKRQAAGTLSVDSYVVETIVTTPMIAAIARSYGVRVIDDLLVGFKYIGAAMDAEGPDQFVFGCEESLGYLAGTYARDKDAAVAALYASELAAELQRDGKTLMDRLDELYARHGVYLESQVSLTCPGPQGNRQIADLMRLFREHPPERIGELELQRLRDYQRQEIRAIPGNRRIGDLPKPTGNLLFAEGLFHGCQARIALRPSGTEPKIKFYLYLHQTGAGGSVVGVRDVMQMEMGRVGSAVFAWAKQAVGDG